MDQAEKETCEQLLDNECVLTTMEIDFLVDLVDNYADRELSVAQRDWLLDIYKAKGEQ